MPSHPSRSAFMPRGSRWLCTAVAAAALAACGGSDDDDDRAPVVPPTAPAAALEIRTLSVRADWVTDGDALVELVLPAGATAAGLVADVDGRDVGGEFATRADGRVTGLLTGLKAGANVLTARTATTGAASLTITNTPRNAPVFSGAQITPFYCATPVPQGATASAPASNASGLSGAPADAQCTTPSEFKLYYRTTAAGCTFGLPDPSPNVTYTDAAPATNASPPANPCFRPYTAGAPAPADLATTTTDAGLSVPYIVRVERGVMNRGIYDLVVLHDPARPWSATAPQPQWNGKVYYQFGSSTGQPRRQIRPQSAWPSFDAQIARGYLVAVNSMTDSAINSNRVMMTETLTRMKERIGDAYGPIRFTMGAGCSGGSINSHMSSSIAPGLLDGVTISCAYPDSETTAIEVGDCVQLVEAYQKPQWRQLMTNGGVTPAAEAAKKAAVNGHPDQTACHGWYNAFGSNAKAGNYVQKLVVSTDGALVPTGPQVNNCQMPANLVYDPVTNPGGARCNAWDWGASIFGKAADGIRANETRDNVGVQYGLKALLAGSITPEEFVVLNEIAGGADHDTNPQAARTLADAPALSVAYRAGLVMSGRNLAKTAVIDMRGWDDSGLVLQPGTAARSTIPIHYVWRSFSIRDRLVREYGDADNHALWRFGRGGLNSPVLAPQAFATMDQWLTSLKADTGARSIEDKVRAARPAGAQNFCLLSSDAAQSTRVTDPAVCDADPFLKASSSPRQVAGGPLSENILKCQLRPLDAAEYGGRLDAAQLVRLNTVFPGGVCDWSKPGVGQQAAVSPLEFSAGPGGRALAAAPVSVMK
jgi:hypothetical protein